MAKTNLEKLMELKQLYEQGILTKEEMEAEKANILGNSNNEYEPISTEQPVASGGTDDTVSLADVESLNYEEESFFQRNKTYIYIGLGVITTVLLFALISRNKETTPLYPDGYPVEEIDTISIPVEADIDPYANRLLIKDIIAVKSDKNSNRLIQLLTDKGFTCDESEEEDYYTSRLWIKTIGNDTAKATQTVRWSEFHSDGVIIYMECDKEVVKQRWVDEMKEMGYAIKEQKNSGNDALHIFLFSKNGTPNEALYYPKNGKGNYTLQLSTSFERVSGVVESEEQERQENIRAIESQAVSMNELLYAFHNNINGRASNTYLNQEKIYSCYFNKIRRASYGYKYVMEGDYYNSDVEETGFYRVYSDDDGLTNLNFPVTICFRGILKRRSAYDEYHDGWYYFDFVCTEPLTYKGTN